VRICVVNFCSMEEIGMLFDRTSHKVGRMLKILGLRTPDGKPSQKAFQGGFVKKRIAEYREGKYHWVRHLEKTVAMLEAAGWRRLPGFAFVTVGAGQ